MNPSQPPIRAILFDLDGTLVVAANRWSERLAIRLRFLNRVFPQMNTRRLAKRLVNSLELSTTYGMLWLEHLGVGSSFFGLADRVRRSKGLATRSASTLIPGSIELLKQLGQQYSLAVVTTRRRKEAEAFLAAADIGRYFQIIVTRSDCWHIKPHPSPVRKAAQLLDAKPIECLMVGDTMLDMRSACRAGARAAGVLTGYDEREELVRAGAEVVLEDASQLPAYLAKTA
ncbi:MAG: HAD family hydrolase [Chloroflexi bacterium]|nr:HAD family hydrolase [Chloroflexota bacterium]